MPPASRWARSVSAQSAHNSKPDHTVLPLAEPKFEGVIGSTIKTKFEMRAGKPVIMRLPKVDFLDDKEGKPVAIHEFIGRESVLAFGISDGDAPRFMGIVHHTDAERDCSMCWARLLLPFLVIYLLRSRRRSVEG